MTMTMNNGLNLVDMVYPEICVQSGSPLLHQGGCDICTDCGYSHCD